MTKGILGLASLISQEFEGYSSILEVVANPQMLAVTDFEGISLTPPSTK
jgi:hypothetical protein